MDLGITKAINNGDGNTIIYTALLAAAIGNMIPTVADGFYFSSQQRWKKQLEEGKITPEKYWTKDIFWYYFVNSTWYFSLFVLMLAMDKKSASSKAKILLALTGGGVVIGVALKNIQKDKQLIADGSAK